MPSLQEEQASDSQVQREDQEEETEGVFQVMAEEKRGPSRELLAVLSVRQTEVTSIAISN